MEVELGVRFFDSLNLNFDSLEQKQLFYCVFVSTRIRGQLRVVVFHLIPH